MSRTRCRSALDWAEAGLRHPAWAMRHAAVGLLEKQRDAWLQPAEFRRKRDIIASRIQPLALLDDALKDEWNRRAAFEFVRVNFDALVEKLPQHRRAAGRALPPPGGGLGRG